MYRRIISIVTENKFAFSIFIIAAFLRLYRLGDFATFLSDQGRDAIIVKRIITFEHFTAIGPPTSVGQVFLGPFYYYLIAPFLGLFRLDPLGMAFGVAFLSLVGTILAYFVIKKEVGYLAGILFLALTTFSITLIEFARFSWNPNLLPFFAFFTLYFGYKLIQYFSTHEKTKNQTLTKIIKENKIAYMYAALLGLFISFCVQLHYLAILIIIPIGIFLFWSLIKNTNRFSQLMSLMVIAFFFVVGNSPLILFDLRHGFLNLKNFIGIFTQQKVVSNVPITAKVYETFNTFLFSITKISLSSEIVLTLTAILIVMIILAYKNKKMNLFLTINLVHILLYIFFFSFVSTPRHTHYYTPVYLSFFLLVGHLFTCWSKKLLNYALMILTIGTYIFLNSSHYFFFTSSPNRQMEHAKKVANSLAEKIGHKPFNIATWPVDFTEDPYLYYLELKGLRPADRQKQEVTDQMFVLCNKDPCLVINSPSWNISLFGRAKSDIIWTVDNIKIYKLVHGTE